MLLLSIYGAICVRGRLLSEPSRAPRGNWGVPEHGHVPHVGERGVRVVLPTEVLGTENGVFSLF